MTDDVRWRVERPKESILILRNVGSGTAEGIELDQQRLGSTFVQIDRPNRVPPQASIKLMVTESLGEMPPTEIWVRWRGQRDFVAVAITT